MLISPKYIISTTPYRGPYEKVVESKSKKSIVGLDDTLLHIDIDYTHLVDLVDIDTELEEDETLQVENRVCEETYIEKKQITSISKQIENVTTENAVEHVYMVIITARGTISNIRCKHNEEASELLQILFNWWRHDIYPKKQDLNITV